MTWTKLAGLSIGLAVALAGTAAFVGARVVAQTAAAEAAFPSEGEVIDVGGVPVHAVVTGSGPDLVLIHGASGNTRDFTFNLTARLSETYRVIALDRPGFGYTGRLGRDNESIADQAMLLQAAAAKLGADRPLVMGHSYGGAVALAWAVNRPDNISGLVLVSAASNPWEGGVDTVYHLVASRPGSAILAPLVSAFYGRERVLDAIRGVFDPQLPPDGYSDYVGAPLTLRPNSLRASAQQRVTLEDEIIAQLPRYGEIGVPTEIIHGDTDTIVANTIHSVPLQKQIAGAQLTVLDGAGHMPHHTHPKVILDAVDRAALRAGLR